MEVCTMGKGRERRRARCMKHTRLGEITPRGKPRGLIKIMFNKSGKENRPLPIAAKPQVSGRFDTAKGII